jgi:hypothetical protein
MFDTATRAELQPYFLLVLPYAQATFNPSIKLSIRILFFMPESLFPFTRLKLFSFRSVSLDQSFSIDIRYRDITFHQLPLSSCGFRLYSHLHPDFSNSDSLYHLHHVSTASSHRATQRGRPRHVLPIQPQVHQRNCQANPLASRTRPRHNHHRPPQGHE